jgi:hypothetical protein
MSLSRRLKPATGNKIYGIPGVARCALTPGYYLAPLRGENN